MIGDKNSRHSLVRASHALLAAMLATSGCSPSKEPKPLYVNTDAHLPDPCSIISGPLARELVGSAQGHQTGSDETSAVCKWEGPGIGIPGRKTGVLITNVTVQRKVFADSSDPLAGAKVSYQAGFIDKKCNAFSSAADQSCWYVDDNGLVVVFRKRYTVARISTSAINSPALTVKRREETVRHIAGDVLKSI